MTGPGAGVDDQALVEALVSSQRLGMLGDRPIAEVIQHAGAFVDALASTTGTVVDLGSGGGVPGLVIARARPDLMVVLVDRRATRADHLRRLVLRLDLSERAEVHAVDARRLATTFGRRADAVVARGFGPPAETLRCAAPLLADDGVIVVSEPPNPAADRWPPTTLDEVGVERAPGDDPRVALFRRPRCFT
ncbi:MAG: RsmG family class I SAM-dependent methyltransferase [Ilumatobacteraceae bacterium]